MTEARERERRNRVDTLEYEMATIRGLCPEGVRPADYVRHLVNENRELREERGRHVYDSPSQGWE